MTKLKDAGAPMKALKALAPRASRPLKGHAGDTIVCPRVAMGVGANASDFFWTCVVS